MIHWPPSLQDEIGNPLLAAQNALTGCWNLSNSDETEEHHQSAQHALDAVREAIRKAGVLEQQGIVEPSPGIRVGDTVRLTDEAYRDEQPTSPFLNSEVVDVYDGRAEVAWIAPALPREVDLSTLEKVERKRSPAAWTDRAAGFAVGDPVQFKPEFLRSSGQVASETARLRDKITGLKPL